jgi:lipopolysaccharide/colanic/teichoic acid biosynthesis glycosyltransferase
MQFPDYRHFWKRWLDLFLAIAALAMLAPVMLVCGLLIYLTMGRPIIFRQPRVGRDEADFTLFKLRTMSDASDDDGQLLPDSQRLTRYGNFLRLASLDELPQLWNILRGDMSFVGPRPLRVEYLPYYTDRERRRHTVRPGLTGLAQISGRNAVDWNERLELDVQYIERMSFWTDIYIALVTAVKVFRAKNVTLPEDVFRSLYDCRPKASEQAVNRQAA